MRKDFFEIVKQSKIDQNIVCLLPYGDSYTRCVDGVVRFVYIDRYRRVVFPDCNREYEAADTGTARGLFE